MADLVIEPVPWEEYHRALQQVDHLQAELARVTAERDRLQEMRRLDYELVKDFDVYGTGGDVSSCLREMKMVLSEKGTALAAEPEVERVREVLDAWRAMEATPFTDAHNSTAPWSRAYMDFERKIRALAALTPEPAAPSGERARDCRNCGHTFYDHANGSRPCDHRDNGNAFECGCDEYEPEFATPPPSKPAAPVVNPELTTPAPSGEAKTCHADRCTSAARYGPEGVAVACWSHAGDWPEIDRPAPTPEAAQAPTREAEDLEPRRKP